MTNRLQKKYCYLVFVLAVSLGSCTSDDGANDAQTAGNAAAAGNNSAPAGAPSSSPGGAGSSALAGTGGLATAGALANDASVRRDAAAGVGGVAAGASAAGVGGVAAGGGGGGEAGAVGTGGLAAAGNISNDASVRRDAAAGVGGVAGGAGTAAGAGAAGVGGTAGGGGMAAGGGGGEAGSGESCEKGRVEASEVIFMGESFYAMPPQYIQGRIEQNARSAGALDANESYRNYAISGQPLDNVIPGEFDTAIAAGPVKVVIMDGGGIDCMLSPCDACPGIFTTLLEKMASNGVQDVIYTRYPEPGNPPGSMHPLKENLDILMPKMEAVCAAATGLRCLWVDLRPVWTTGDTIDGLHPTASGGEHVGDAIWATMVENCIAQ